ncbi:MAG: Crp/Fnr family transcriptional regulator, partial [Bacteroidota bacterium]
VSRKYLETITPTRLLKISYPQQMKMIEAHRPLETLFRKWTEQLLIGIIQRQHELMAFDIETRFRIFIKRSPHLLNQIPRKDLASYLRIEASNFSKLLNKVRVE